MLMSVVRGIKLYMATWEIDVEAETPGEAAGMAREIQQDKQSIATVYTVRHLASGQKQDIDLG